MSKRLAGLVAWALMGWVGFAQALGLGEIESRSRLNQPVAATIPILSASGAEADSLTVELANNEEFERAGIERTEFLSTLRFVVEGETIRVTSKQIAREPFVSFLLSVRWSGGRLLREYTLLLDPPNLARASGAPAKSPTTFTEAPAPAESAPAAPEAAAAAEPPAESMPAETGAAPAAEAPPTGGSAEGGSYGPVSPKETLWSIAYKLRPDLSLTMDQMQVAIFNANPKAFHGGQITGLMKGSMLTIPGAGEVRAVDAAAAKRLVAQAREGGSAVAAAPPRPVVEPAPAPVEQAPPPQESAPPPPEPAPSVTAEATPPPPTQEAAPPSDAGAPPPSEAAAAPAPAETEPAPQAAEPPPVETQPAPAPVVSAPIKQEPGILDQVTDTLKGVLENKMVMYIVGGLLGLIVLALVGKKAADKIAQARYDRASKQVEAARTGGGPTLGDSEVTQVAPDAPSAFGAAADAPTVVSGPKLAATVAMGSDTMQQTMQQTQVQESPQAATGGRAVDFDVTSNFASETVQINLDAGDPLSEAEFHRAYGLYDEAALMLKQALQKDPSRTDAKVKLAEIYFEAGKANEFVEVAKELKGQLPDDKWQSIALLGSQIAPNNGLFSGAGGVGGAVDLSFDEPAAAAPSAPAPAAAPAGDALEFDLGSLSLETAAAAPAAAPAPAAAAPAGDALEFDLGAFDAAAAPASEPAPAASAPAAASADLGLDLGGFDISSPTQAVEVPASGGEVLDLGGEISDAAAAPTDETGTKLDLARAYLDMGDADMAKSLLNEVAQQGNDAQKKEAEELLKRASA